MCPARYQHADNKHRLPSTLEVGRPLYILDELLGTDRSVTCFGDGESSVMWSWWAYETPDRKISSYGLLG